MGSLALELLLLFRVLRTLFMSTLQLRWDKPERSTLKHRSTTTLSTCHAQPKTTSFQTLRTFLMQILFTFVVLTTPPEPPQRVNNLPSLSLFAKNEDLFWSLTLLMPLSSEVRVCQKVSSKLRVLVKSLLSAILSLNMQGLLVYDWAGQ